MDGDECLVLLMSPWPCPVFLTVSLFCKFLLSEKKKQQLCNPLIFQVLLMFWFWGMASSSFESQRIPWLRRDLTDGMSSVFHCLDRSCFCGGHVWLLIGGLCGHFVALDRTSVQRRYSWNLLWPLQHVHGCCSSSCQPPQVSFIRGGFHLFCSALLGHLSHSRSATIHKLLPPPLKSEFILISVSWTFLFG